MYYVGEYQQKYFLITGNAISLHMLSENYTQNLVRGDNLGNLGQTTPKFH